MTTLKIDDVTINDDEILDMPMFKVTTIEVGDETDEDFQTRRNTFGRWLMGLPKQRHRGRPAAGRVEITPLVVSLSKEKGYSLANGNWVKKKDIVVDDGRIFCGSFPCEISTFDKSYIIHILVDHIEEN